MRCLAPMRQSLRERKRGFEVLQEQRGLWTSFFHGLIPDPEQKSALSVAPSEGDVLRAGICLWCGQSVSAIQEGCVCSGHVSISGARGLGTVKWEVLTLTWAVCAPLCLQRLQQIRVCFNHFAATERSRHFQGLTHLTCFRNVPGDEAHCIPEGLFPLLPPRRHLGWFSQMQIPALDDRCHPASTCVGNGCSYTRN